MGIARLYKTGTPYNAVDLRDLDFEQSADVMYLAHLNYPPSKLTRSGHTSWAFSTVAFGPTISAPTGVSASPSGSTGDAGYNATPYNYVVTAIDDSVGQESRASAVATCINDLTLDGHYNTISWTLIGSDRYAVYKGYNGTFGYIGTSTTSSFQDRDIAADLSDTPAVGQNPFVGAGNYPSTVTFFQQRLVWARTANKINGMWFSQSADFENMDTSRPAKADDAITLALVAGRVNAVNQLASMKSLLALTSDAVFSLDGGSQGDAVTPSNIVSSRQTGRGSARLGPLVIDNVTFFRPSQGSSVRTLGYTFQQDGYESNNMAIFSPHFFDGFDIIAWAYQQEPYACIWAVRDDGVLLCMTWEQEQQVWGWTLCQTDGLVQDVCVITEDGMDRVYLAVQRTLAGSTDVFIERMALPLLVADQLTAACYLDCAVTQQNTTPSAIVTGLWHLEGETVSAFHDGDVTTGLMVSGGSVTLPRAVTIATVGLPYSGIIETLPLVLNGQQGSGNVKRQMIAKATIRVVNTRGITVGPGGGQAYELKQRQSEPIGTPIQLQTGDFEVPLSARWNNGATVVVEQTYPLPATVTAIFPEAVVTS